MDDKRSKRVDESTEYAEPSGTMDVDPPATCPELADSERDQAETDPEREREREQEPESKVKQSEIFKAIEVVEKDSLAIAESFSSLFSSLRLALSEVTSGSVDHMQCFGDAAGRLQESVLDASTKGNRYINSCLRLNEEMKGIDNLAMQLKLLRRNVDALDSAVNRMLRFP